MKLGNVTIASAYTSKMGLALLSQMLCLLLSGLILDCGNTSRVVAIAMLAHWVSIGMIVFRNPDKPKRFDLGYIAIGFFAILALTFAVAEWRLLFR